MIVEPTRMYAEICTTCLRSDQDEKTSADNELATCTRMSELELVRTMW